MNTRAFVLIFFFWAFLTIITPTLILLSESSKTDLDQNGKVSEGMKPRKMMTYSEKHPPSTPITPPAKKVPLTPTAAPVDQPAFRIQNQTNDQVNIRRLLKSVSMSSWLITMCKYATCAY
ncbi:hypothetical protein CUMW_071680 [Citrus unshiu]|nr:hypothetical protein CUMW_071680 [Citrus unshiu]